MSGTHTQPVNGDHPMLSVVIPTLNCGRTLRTCLEGLRDVDYDRAKFEVVIADGGSTDGTREIVREFPFCRLVESDATGPIAGRIDGLRASRGEIIAYIDGDTNVDRDWAKNGVAALLELSRSSNAGAVGGAIRVPRTSAWIEANGVFLAIAYLARFSIQSERVEETRPVSMIPTINFFARKDALERVLPFRWEGFGEDIELSYRITQLGYRMFTVPGVALWHYRRETQKEFFNEMANYARGRYHFLRVHAMRSVKFFLPPLLIVAFSAATLLSAFAHPAAPFAMIAGGYAASVALALYASRGLGYSIAGIALAPVTCVIACCAWSWGWLSELLHPSADSSVPAPILRKSH